MYSSYERRKPTSAAVVELVALENAEIKYSTVQNWYPGDKDGKGVFITLYQTWSL